MQGFVSLTLKDRSYVYEKADARSHQDLCVDFPLARADMVLALSVVSFLCLNLKSVHSFAFLGSVAYTNKASVVTGVEGRNSDTITT